MITEYEFIQPHTTSSFVNIYLFLNYWIYNILYNLIIYEEIIIIIFIIN